MLRWKTICCNLYLVATFTASVIRGNHERALGCLVSLATKRNISYFINGKAPDADVYNFAQDSYMLSQELQSTLAYQNQERAHALYPKTVYDPAAQLAPLLREIDKRVAGMLKVDLKTMDFVTEFFEMFSGKHFHASILLQLAKTFNSNVTQSQSQFAECIEIVHCGNILHSQIDAQQLGFIPRLLKTKGLILGGDYMISNAAVVCCKTGSTALIQLLCTIIQNLSLVNYKQAAVISVQTECTKERLLRFCELSFYKSASMLANGCQGIALLAQKELKPSYQFGKHLGMAACVSNDIQSYLNGNLTINLYPVLFAGAKYPEIFQTIQTGNTSRAKELVQDSNGLEKARRMSLAHLEESYKWLEVIGASEDLVYLIGKAAKRLY